MSYVQPYHRRSRVITRKQILERRRFHHKIMSIVLGIIFVIVFVKATTYPPVLADSIAEPYEPTEPVIQYEKEYSAAEYESPNIIEEEEPEIILEEVIVEYEEPPMESTSEPVLEDYLGEAVIAWNDSTLTMMATPDKDYWTFQPYEDYHCITNTQSSAYQVTYSANSYTDDNGFRRVAVSDGMFSIGTDDYCVAMGTYYKPKGICGIRFLIVTDTGMYTVITADEKSDLHTNSTHMYTTHGENDQYAGVLEYLVDTDLLPDMVSRMGSVHYAPFAPLNGRIQMIYRID